ncbi:hypothetical protein C8J57DRAFT_1232168 [Mycena rebaudengoi]|nr:hypothetical protein C8J57DRAFT_1232168 [Mycena rebaudengoi]
MVIPRVYANSFLPSGPVEERTYDMGDAEAQLLEILDTSDLTSGDVPNFMWPYALAKSLAERILLARYPELPTLIMRPTIIGPALACPHPFYGSQNANPVSVYIHKYFTRPDQTLQSIIPSP